MELNAIQDSFERVAKRQKLSSSKSKELIIQVGNEIEQALARIQSGSDSTVSVDQKTVLTELKAKLQVVGSHTHLEGPQRELNTNLSRYQKLLEKGLHPDISRACVNADLDRHILNQIIICHFYFEGLFDIVDCLIKEAGEPEAVSLRLQYQEIHQILEALKSRNLEPAFNWVAANQERLKESGSDLELKLHTLHFVDVLQNQGRAEALRYAKTYFAPLASRHMNEIQRLMCSILWAGRLDKSPYPDLVDPIHWETIAEELMRTFCNFTGQSIRDPLSIAVAAGMEGLPTLLKLANVMSAKKQEWEAMRQLPVPVELGKEFQFHSIFVCPVSRDQCSEENPPMLLPCGHVLCKQSINKLSKGNSRNFKCPYCPEDASVAQCKQLCL
ncbi:hypothetical protein C2S52_003956 [Perilla frutescens var. hirtella]|nr:hypothetical protein C2S51_011592 [Perilla frutescens var. frutescens]KAH6793479.1 hypothetical protein C2S52_003956 [Perilla frutescens var. hirtella]